MKNSIDFYNENVEDRRVLTKEEEIELVERMKSGDETAKEELIKHNLRLVISIASRFKEHEGCISFDDLIQEGNIGLMKAVDKWDPTRGYKFSTYAVYWIYTYIRRHFYKNVNDLSVSYNYSNKSFKVKSTLGYYNKMNKKPTLEEVSLKSGLSINEIENALSFNYDFVDIDEEVKDNDIVVEDLISDNKTSLEEQSYYNILKEDIKEVMHNLSKREADILRFRFGLYDGKIYSLDEIGKKYGISRERVRQLEERTLSKLSKSNFGLKYREEPKSKTLKRNN